MRIKFNIDYKIEKKKVIEKIKMVLFKSMIKMEELAIQKVPVDTSRLKNSIKIFPMIVGLSSYSLFTPVEYASDVEYGTSPNYVGIENLKGWSRRVLGDEKLAYAVQKKIALRGTDAKPYFRPALDEVRLIWVQRIWKQEFSKP